MRISKDQSIFLKGLSILLIVFHNFFHFLPPVIGENEFDWDASRIQNFFQFTLNAPLEVINNTFSYFGHYGVQVFILLSGYGLAVKYANYKGTLKLKPFLRQRLAKIYPVYSIAILYSIVILLYFDNGIISFNFVKSIVFKLLFINNFIPEEAFRVSGPWWFFSLIVQLYLLFPYILRLFQGTKLTYIHGILFMGAYFLSFIYLKPIFESFELNILYLFLGHLPEFVLGIVLAFYPSYLKKNYLLIGFTISIFVLANFIELLFPISFVCIAYFLLRALLWLERVLHTRLKKSILQAGELSFYLFAVHGVLIDPILFFPKDLPPILKIGSVAIFFALSIISAVLVKEITMILKKKL